MRTARCSGRLSSHASPPLPHMPPFSYACPSNHVRAPLWTEWPTGVKTLPCRNEVAGSKYLIDSQNCRYFFWKALLPRTVTDLDFSRRNHTIRHITGLNLVIFFWKLHENEKIGAQKRGLGMRLWQPPWIHQYPSYHNKSALFNEKTPRGRKVLLCVTRSKHKYFTNLVLILHCFSCSKLKWKSTLKLVPNRNIANHYSNGNGKYCCVLTDFTVVIQVDMYDKNMSAWYLNL